ncbi:Arm DNA-binding domain-containing protein [Sinomicrobium sp. M5D2P17]
MRSTNTFSSTFGADLKKATNDEVLIYVCVTVNGKRTNMSTKRKIAVSLWDTKKKKAKSTFTEARQVNLYLERVKTQLFQYYQDLKFK